MHTQNLRVKASGSGLKMAQLNLQKVAALNQNMILTVPINVAGTEGG